MELYQPLHIILSQDKDGAFIAETEVAPEYGYGDTPAEAVYSLITCLESLHRELNADDSFHGSWKAVRAKLNVIFGGS